uniref:Uncharacterized protein n=1 Tax=Scleropages formosus TaxID=113540 RepID=A0A8C9QUD0_SCLFO
MWILYILFGVFFILVPAAHQVPDQKEVFTEKVTLNPRQCVLLTLHSRVCCRRFFSYTPLKSALCFTH